MRPPPAAVIFDWGGTLTPWHDVDLVEMWRGYAAVYQPADADRLASALAAAELDSYERGRLHQRSATLDELFASVGVRPAGERHRRALAAYLAGWEPHTVADPDAAPLLRQLRKQGLRIGVLSNTLWPRTHHEAVFRRDGLADLIDGAVYSSELPWTKPHPAAFGAALAAIGVADPARAVFVGDRLFDDVHGAKEAGLRAVWVPHSRVPHYEVTPDATIQRLAELPDVLSRWADPAPDR